MPGNGPPGSTSMSGLARTAHSANTTKTNAAAAPTAPAAASLRQATSETAGHQQAEHDHRGVGMKTVQHDQGGRWTGDCPVEVQARKRTPGAISTVRSSTVISKRATVPPTGAGRWAGNGTSVRPPCARSRRLRRSGAAAELRDGRKRAPAESAPRPPRSMLRRDVAGSCKAAGRCTARSSLSGSLAPVSIAALLELIDGVYAHPSLSVWVVAPVSVPILLKTFRLTARPKARAINGLAPSLGWGKSTAGLFRRRRRRGLIAGGAERPLRTRWRSGSGPARASVTPSLHRRAGPPAVRGRTTLTA